MTGAEATDRDRRSGAPASPRGRRCAGWARQPRPGSSPTPTSALVSPPRPTTRARRGRVRAALTAPLSFDTSWEGRFWMIAGCEPHLVEDAVRRDPEVMVDCAADHGIGFLDVTP